MYSRKHYMKVLEEAKGELAGVDARERALVCGFDYVAGTGDGAALEFDSLGTRFSVDCDTWDIKNMLTGRDMPLQFRILTLHLLWQAKDVEPTGDIMPLKAFRGLEMYEQVIRRRSDNILIRRFGDRSALLIKTVEELKGEKVDMGDAGGRFWPFPKMPVLAVVYEAEPGLPAEANMLFDSTADRLFHIEDLVVTAELLAHKLVNVALKYM